uniref:Probable pectate lyase F n=1 Tax=Globodera rostochiensis TaxID=31243 RepID=Q53EK1_GLORO|nr:pectate lyase 2 precursor [Globodera rostochiensis]
MLHHLFVLCFFFANLTPIFANWPTATGDETVPETMIIVGGIKDFKFKRLSASLALGTGDQHEDQKRLFVPKKGAVIKNLIIGKNGADGIHCYDSCTLENVWFESVGEDATTFRTSKDCGAGSFVVTGGGARNAHDKVFQMNGGGQLTIRNYVGENIGKLARSCGNCEVQCKNRKFVVENVKVTGLKTMLIGLNENYGDAASIKNVQVNGKTSAICCEFIANNQQQEPKLVRSYGVGSAGDAKNCIISGAKSG